MFEGFVYLLCAPCCLYICIKDCKKGKEANRLLHAIKEQMYDKNDIYEFIKGYTAYIEKCHEKSDVYVDEKVKFLQIIGTVVCDNDLLANFTHDDQYGGDCLGNMSIFNKKKTIKFSFSLNSTEDSSVMISNMDDMSKIISGTEMRDNIKFYLEKYG